MKRKKYTLTGSASASCLLLPLERKQVEAVTATVTMEFSQMGKRNRWKMMNALSAELKEKARLTLPVFIGCYKPVGGFTCGEPKEVA